MKIRKNILGADMTVFHLFQLNHVENSASNVNKYYMYNSRKNMLCFSTYNTDLPL